MRFDRANRFLPIRSRGLGQLPARRHPHPSITPPADQQPTDLLTLGVLRSYRQNDRSQHLQASFLRAAGNETTTNDCASTIIKRNYIFVSTVFVGAFGLQLAFDTASDSLWNNINKGRQWKDIKHQYLEKEDDDE
ncbi:ubiquinol-cytochrome C reductase [Phyllosticta citricarpa]